MLQLLRASLDIRCRGQIAFVDGAWAKHRSKFEDWIIDGITGHSRIVAKSGDSAVMLTDRIQKDIRDLLGSKNGGTVFMGSWVRGKEWKTCRMAFAASVTVRAPPSTEMLTTLRVGFVGHGDTVRETFNVTSNLQITNSTLGDVTTRYDLRTQDSSVIIVSAPYITLKDSSHLRFDIGFDLNEGGESWPIEYYKLSYFAELLFTGFIPDIVSNPVSLTCECSAHTSALDAVISDIAHLFTEQPLQPSPGLSGPGD